MNWVWWREWRRAKCGKRRKQWKNYLMSLAVHNTRVRTFSFTYIHCLSWDETLCKFRMSVWGWNRANIDEGASEKVFRENKWKLLKSPPPPRRNHNVTGKENSIRSATGCPPPTDCVAVIKLTSHLKRSAFHTLYSSRRNFGGGWRRR